MRSPGQQRKIESLQAAYEDVGSRLRYTWRPLLKKGRFYPRATYESYIDKGILTVEGWRSLGDPGIGKPAISVKDRSI